MPGHRFLGFKPASSWGPVYTQGNAKNGRVMCSNYDSRRSSVSTFKTCNTERVFLPSGMCQVGFLDFQNASTRHAAHGCWVYPSWLVRSYRGKCLTKSGTHTSNSTRSASHLGLIGGMEVSLSIPCIFRECAIPYTSSLKEQVSYQEVLERFAEQSPCFPTDRSAVGESDKCRLLDIREVLRTT